MYGIKLFVSNDLKQNNVWGAYNKTEPLEGAVNVSKVNQSVYSSGDDEYIFDRTDVRAIFITLYTIVFCCCFFGEYNTIYKIAEFRELQRYPTFGGV